MNKIAQELFAATDTIVDKKLQSAGYDKTIIGTVVQDLGSKKYLIQYQNAQFVAFAMMGASYAKGNQVLILLPENSFATTKYILGGITRTDGSSDLDTFIMGKYQEDLDSIAESFYQDTDPSVDWKTEKEKKKHLGDMWKDTTDNTEYIWSFVDADEDGVEDTYRWVESPVPDAIFDAIDGKSKVFFGEQPPTNYSTGDLWYYEETKQGAKGQNVTGYILKIANVDDNVKTRVDYVADDWVLYESAEGKLLQTQYESVADDLKQLDNRIETFTVKILQDTQNEKTNSIGTDPSLDWVQDKDGKPLANDKENVSSHEGDLVLELDTGLMYQWENVTNARDKNRIERDGSPDINGKAQYYAWIKITANKDLADAAAKGAIIYTSVNTAVAATAKAGDLLIPSTSVDGYDYEAGKVYRYNDSSKQWEEISYTDTATFTQFKTDYEDEIDIIKVSIDKKSEVWYQDMDPSTSWTDDDGNDPKKNHIGDLWKCSADVKGDNYKEFKKHTEWLYSKNYVWENTDFPDGFADKVDGKSSIYVVTTEKDKDGNLKILSITYSQGDTLWPIEEVTVTDATENTKTFYKGQPYTATNDIGKSFAVGDWEASSAYATVNDEIDEVDNFLVDHANRLDTTEENVKSLQSAGGKVQKALNIEAKDDGTTFIIRPAIGGGYLNIYGTRWNDSDADGEIDKEEESSAQSYRVIIDPSGVDDTEYYDRVVQGNQVTGEQTRPIFAIKKVVATCKEEDASGKIIETPLFEDIMAVDTDGNASFTGAIRAGSVLGSGFQIQDAGEYVKIGNSTVIGQNPGDWLEQIGSCWCFSNTLGADFFVQNLEHRLILDANGFRFEVNDRGTVKTGFKAEYSKETFSMGEFAIRSSGASLISFQERGNTEQASLYFNDANSPTKLQLRPPKKTLISNDTTYTIYTFEIEGTAQIEEGVQIRPAYDKHLIDFYTSDNENYNTNVANLHMSEDGTTVCFGKFWDFASSVSATSTDSDRNLKHDISILPNAYSTLFDNLKPVVYKYNNGTSDRLHTGFIAQDVDEAMQTAELTRQDFAGLCIEDEGLETERWRLRYEEFIALNTSEIQKLKTRIAELEEKIEILGGNV